MNLCGVPNADGVAAAAAATCDLTNTGNHESNSHCFMLVLFSVKMLHNAHVDDSSPRVRAW